LYGHWQRGDKKVDFFVYPDGTCLQKSENGTKTIYEMGTWSFSTSNGLSSFSNFHCSFPSTPRYAGAKPGGFFAGDSAIANGDTDCALDIPSESFYRLSDDLCIPTEKIQNEAKLEGRPSFIDHSGTTIINGPFYAASNFKDGTARVWWTPKCDKLPKLCDCPGESIIDEKGVHRSIYEAQRFRTRNGIICTSGFNAETRVISYQFPEEKQGRRLFQVDQGGQFKEPTAFRYADDSVSKFGFMNVDGSILIEPKFDSASGFHEGLASVLIDNKYRFIRNDETFAFGDRYDFAGNFSEGLARVMVDEQWGFIGKNGDLLIAPKFDWVGNFQNGYAPAKFKQQTCFIDSKGRIVAKTPFVGAMGYSEGLFPVLCSNGLWGYADVNGKIVIKPRFTKALPYSEGRALVQDPFLKIPADAERSAEQRTQVASQLFLSGRAHLDRGEMSSGIYILNGLIKCFGEQNEYGIKATKCLKTRGVDKAGDQECTAYSNILTASNKDNQLVTQKLAAEACAKFPNFLPAKSALAYAYMNQRKFDECERVLLPVIEQHPEYARAYIILASCKMKRGDKESAHIFAQKAREVDPLDPFILKTSLEIDL